MKYLLINILIGLFVLLIVSVFTGCSKEEKGKYHTAVYGKFLDYDTDEPIPDALILLLDGRAGSVYDIYPSPSTNLVDSSYTDKNGVFFVELKNHYTEAIIGAIKEGYYDASYTEDGYMPIAPDLDPGIYTHFVIRKKRSSYGE